MACECRICQLARADAERALFYGWDGHGSVAPFLRALDARQGVTEFLGEGNYAQPLCPRCREICTPARHLACNDAECSLRAADHVQNEFPTLRAAAE